MNRRLHVGFTGTRGGMTGAQFTSVKAVAESWASVPKLTLHHGDCIGADEQAHRIFRSFPRPGWQIEIHPCTLTESRAYTNADATHPAKPPLDRNRDIVLASQGNPTAAFAHEGVVLATPQQAEEVQRSGTWATIRYALKANRLVLLIRPDGSINPLIPEKGRRS